MIAQIQIETDRLLLRTVTMSDVDDVAGSWKLDDPPISKEDAEKQIRWMMGNHRRSAPGSIVHLCLAIVDKDTQEFIGWCGLDHRDKTQKAPAIFYLLKTDHWGKGLATEVAQSLLDYAFSELRLPEIAGKTALENLASKRVMEKIGMKYNGVDETDSHSFSMTQREYSQAGCNESV